MTQAEALSVLHSGHNVFLTGPAGSGKTYLLNQFIAQARRAGRQVAVTASTGIAATHLDGITIHSWSGIGIANALSQQDIKKLVKAPHLSRRFRSTDVLIIDEVSMLDEARLGLISEVLRAALGNWLPFGGIQVVLCGDFFQLPPVAREEEEGRFAFMSPVWQEANFRICYLEEQFRQSDPAMTRILNDIRRRSVSEETKKLLATRFRKPIEGIQKPTHLYPHNLNVDMFNDRELGKLSGSPKTYRMTASGKERLSALLMKNCLAPEVLNLKLGARVMFVKNNFEAGYVNGTTGEIIGFEGENPVVQTKHRRITVGRLSWKLEDGAQVLAEITQFPLRLAWAITIHKSQGMSLDAAEMDLSKTFVPGMGYVALSRIRTLDGLSLLGMNQTAFEVVGEVHAVDQKMKAASDEFMKNFKPEPLKEVKREKPAGGYDEVRKTAPSAYEGWSDDEESRLVWAFDSGTPLKDIAKAHGRKVGGIRSRLKKLGLLD